MAEKEFFTPEELSVIDSKLRFIVFDWATHLISHVIGQAKQKGVNQLYWNTSDTLESGATQDDKVDYFYERLPPKLGFKETSIDLRGKGEERLWGMTLVSIKSSAFHGLFKMAEKTFTIQQIPKKYQGAFIGLIGKKDFYTEADVKKVIETVGKRQQKKPTARFFYDWNREWSGAQRFNEKTTEMVVLQKMTTDIQNMVLEDPALKKFWAYLLSQPGHFGPDVLGFALVSPINTDVWVINEIQTDCINGYLKIRNKVQDYKDKGNSETKATSWDTITDMLEAQNRSNWIPRLENNEPMKQQLMNNPNMIHSLPDNSVDIDKWISEQQAQGAGGVAGLDLMRHFQSVDINAKVIRTY